MQDDGDLPDVGPQGHELDEADLEHVAGGVFVLSSQQQSAAQVTAQYNPKELGVEQVVRTKSPT